MGFGQKWENLSLFVFQQNWPKQIALNLNLKQYRFKKSNNLHLFSGVSP